MPYAREATRTSPDGPVGPSSLRREPVAIGPSTVSPDVLSITKTPAIKAWLHPDRLLLDQPGRALVRRLAHQMIPRGAHKNIQAVEADIRAWVNDWDADPS